MLEELESIASFSYFE
jgi:hypothetical protein